MSSWANNMVNLLFSLASNKPPRHGVYKIHAKDDIKELLTEYESDLCEAAEMGHLDSHGITRMASMLYLFKDNSFENIWWRIENRVHELAEQSGALDNFHLTNILRAFSRANDNNMAGSDKLFVHLEPLVM